MVLVFIVMVVGVVMVVLGGGIVVVVEWDSAPLFPWVGSIRLGDLRWEGHFFLPRGSGRVRTPGTL